MIKVTCITIDAHDPEKLSVFWADALGWNRAGHIVVQEGGTTYLEFCPTDEPKVVKNRVHLGLHTDDLDAEIGRLESIGATWLWEELFPPDWPHRNVVLCDPEGNEFCLGAEGTRPGL